MQGRNVTAEELDQKLLTVLQSVDAGAEIGHFSDYLQGGHDQLMLVQPIGENQQDKGHPTADLIAVRYALVIAVNLSKMPYTDALTRLRGLTRQLRSALRAGVLTPGDRPRPEFEIGRPEQGQWLVAEGVISISIAESD